MAGRAAVLGAVRRIAIFYLAVLGAAVSVSLLLGLAAHAHLQRAVAVGCYALGAVCLVGCLAFGIRGPLRGVSSSGETVPLVAARGVRKATGRERLDATHTSLLLFALGISYVVIGALLDPAHRAF